MTTYCVSRTLRCKLSGALSFFHALAAISLVAFSGRLRGLLGHGEREGPLPAFASAAATLAFILLLVSALLFCALARPLYAGKSAMVRYLYDIA